MKRINTWCRHFPVFLLLALSSILIAAACNKDEDTSSPPIIPFECDPPTSYTEMRNCHRDNDRSREELLFGLYGKWNWQVRVHLAGTIDSSSTIYEGMQIEFLNTNQFIIHDSTPDTLFYDIRNVGAESAELYVPNDSLYYLDGNFFLCKNELLIMYHEMYNDHWNWFCKEE